jgi:predicted Zn-dependent protease
MRNHVAIGLLCFAMATTHVGAVDYVRLSPSEFAEDLARASALAEAGHYAAAIVLLEILVNDEPKDPDALSLLGYSLRKSGSPTRAEHFYRRALQVDPDHLGANQYLGELYVELGDLDQASVRLQILDAVCDQACTGRDALAAAIGAAKP